MAKQSRVKEKGVFALSTFSVLGGAGALVAIFIGYKRAGDVMKNVEEKVVLGGNVKARLTGYWPFTARPDELKMEGGLNDRKGKPLYTLEQHIADPDKYPYVSLSGDDAVWPYGQRVVIPELGKNSKGQPVVCRVVDTGSHFRGLGKVVRVLGHEPIDICVDSSKTKVPKLVTLKVVSGDNFVGGKPIAMNKLTKDSVVGEDSQSEEVEYRSPEELDAEAMLDEAPTPDYVFDPFEGFSGGYGDFDFGGGGGGGGGGGMGGGDSGSSAGTSGGVSTQNATPQGAATPNPTVSEAKNDPISSVASLNLADKTKSEQNPSSTPSGGAYTKSPKVETMDNGLSSMSSGGAYTKSPKIVAMENSFPVVKQGNNRNDTLSNAAKNGAVFSKVAIVEPEKKESLVQKAISKISDLVSSVSIPAQNIDKTPTIAIIRDTPKQDIVRSVVPLQDTKLVPVLTQQSVPLVRDPVPLVQSPAPIVQKSIPLVQDPVPLVRDPMPLVQSPVPVIQKSIPLVQDPMPLVQKSVPLVAPVVSKPLVQAPVVQPVLSRPVVQAPVIQRVVPRPQPVITRKK